MNRYSINSLYKWFRKILWKAGIPHGGRGIGPRVHSFRHYSVFRTMPSQLVAFLAQPENTGFAKTGPPINSA